MRAILSAIAIAALAICACDSTESRSGASQPSTERADGVAPAAGHDESAGLMARQVLPGAWQAGSIRRFHSAEGSKRAQGVNLGGGDATEPMVQRFDEAVVQQNMREVFES